VIRLAATPKWDRWPAVGMSRYCGSVGDKHWNERSSGCLPLLSTDRKTFDILSPLAEVEVDRLFNPREVRRRYVGSNGFEPDDAADVHRPLARDEYAECDRVGVILDVEHDAGISPFHYAAVLRVEDQAQRCIDAARPIERQMA
jgi:hypothetical protein